jgi:hypothetical protein
VVWKENRGGLPQDIVVFGEKSRKKSGKKWPFLTSIFWPFHRCETGKRGYGVKFQVSQIKKWRAFFNRVSKIETAICEETERGI